MFGESPKPNRTADELRAEERTQERRLIERLRDGDMEAFETIVAKHIDRLTRFATYLLGSADTAEDCVQMVLVHLWEHRDDLDVSRPLRPYLLRAVHNRVVSERRAESVRTKYQNALERVDAARTQVPSPEDAILSRTIVQDAIQQLPERRQLVLRLWLQEGLTDPEIAETLGISPEATDRLIRRALADVREILLVSKKTGDTRT